MIYNKEVQTTAIETESPPPGREEEIRQRIIRERDIEEQAARDKELEDQSEKLDLEIAQEIRGTLFSLNGTLRNIEADFSRAYG